MVFEEYIAGGLKYMCILGIESNVVILFFIIFITLVIFVLNQPWFSLKSLKKHFTVVNIITGITSLIVIFIIKESGLPTWLIFLLSKHIPSFEDCPEYLIASFIGLICRLGLKGLIEEGFKEIFPTYHSMTGTGDINSPENNNSGGIKENTSGDSSSTTNNSTGVQKKESLSDKGKTLKKPVILLHLILQIKFPVIMFQNGMFNFSMNMLHVLAQK